MKLLDVINAAEGRVCGGAEFQWLCWGDNARFMEFADVDGMEFCTVVFDSKTYDVYDIELFVPGTDQSFKWFNPEFKDAYVNECRVRNIDPLLAWENVYHSELLDIETAMEYLRDIAATYYDNLPIPETE